MSTDQSIFEQLSGDEMSIREFLETHLVDDDGLVLSHVNVDTLKPWTAEELAPYAAPDLHFSNRERFHEVLAYENTLMATGEYASSQVARFEATGEPDALAAAANQVAAILGVYREGEWHEKGYLPKPHGGMARARLSHQISPDQYIKCVVALMAFRPHATPSQRRAVESYLVATADYFLARNFMHPWRDRVMVTPKTIFHSLSLYVPILRIAANLTGDGKYTDAFDVMSDPLDTFLDESRRQPIYGVFNICSLLVEGFHLAMKEGHEDPRLPKCMKIIWELALSLIRDDGSAIHADYQPLLTSRVLRLAPLAPWVETHFPDSNATTRALEILQSIRDPLRMLYFYDNTNGQTLPADDAYQGRSICETSVSGWLLGYWRMRQCAACAQYGRSGSGNRT